MIKTILNENIKPSYYFEYYFFISVIFLILFFSKYLNEKMEINLIISFTSIVITLYVVELFLLYATSSSMLSFDSREKLEVVNDQKKYNEKVTLSIPPSSHLGKDIDLYPFSGISRSETILCNEIGYWVKYTSDRYGFNNNDQNWNKKEIENLLIGDSFVHGHCVDYKHTFNGHFERKTKQSVLSLAYAGTGPLIHLGMLKEYLLNKKIKNLTLFYYEENDLIDLKNELKSKILIKYKQKNFLQNLSQNQSVIDEYLSNIIREKEKTYNHLNHKIVKFLKLFHVRNIIRSPLITNKSQKDIDLEVFKKIKNDNLLKDYEQILIHILELCNDRDISFRVVYLPSYGRYNINKKNENLYLKQDIINIFKKNNINFIDVDNKIFEKSLNPNKYFQREIDNHYTVEAYEEISSLIINEIYN